jgi:hypothetical protein
MKMPRLAISVAQRLEGSTSTAKAGGSLLLFVTLEKSQRDTWKLAKNDVQL